MAKEKFHKPDHEELQAHWFDWWEDDDGFNIKAGARQEKMDIFFMPDKDPENENEEDSK